MSMLQDRGGAPHVFNEIITTTGRKHDIRSFTQWIRITATVSPCLVYFTEDDFTNGTNAVTIAADSVLEAPLEIRYIWLKGSGGSSTVSLLAAKRLN